MIPCASPGCPEVFDTPREARGHLAVCAHRVWPVQATPRALVFRLLACGHRADRIPMPHDAAACRMATDHLLDVLLRGGDEDGCAFCALRRRLEGVA